MECAEALLALGLGGTSEWETLSAEALKRAYLKKVRAHPPERDPDGFRHVREAYELLRALEAARSEASDPPWFPVGLTTSAQNTASMSELDGHETEPVAETRESRPDGSALDRLQQALNEKHYDTAADTLIGIYATATASPHPPPHQVLFVITRQFISGAQDRGRRLLLAFEADMELMNTPLSPRLAANWRLLAELVALSVQLPPHVVGALAGAIELGDFNGASEVLRGELRGHSRQSQVKLRSLLQTTAPTLYEAAWPSTRFLSRKVRRSIESWAVDILSLTVTLGCLWHLTLAATNDRVDRSRAAVTNATGGTGLGALSSEQTKELGVVTSKLEKVTRFSRCNQLRAVWADYASVVRRLKDYESVMPAYEQHRVEAGSTCPKFESELSESP